ncbi:hypothetical protein BVRB_004670 [Beta vulgaris subsp. vulgaris]|uniref:Uncharacterized protein n=1 Tax=Beta vulgaris subsp. vulgaris TaxID=3555 RepID=A0A0J8B3R9_BETVV|nr:hypothetical protein BVRB_004670 [Beta vulgaris subsp. vulgaris]
MSGRDKGKAKSLPTDSGHRHPHDRGVTISSRKARELLFRSTQSSSGAETEEVPEIPPLSVALPTPIMDIEAWRPHSPWRGNLVVGNDQEAGTYYDSQPEHPSTDAEEGRPSRGCKLHTSRGRFARFSDGASCNVEGSGSSRPGKRKGTEEDTSWLVHDARPGGPLDGSVIPSFGGHIAARVWAGEDERTMLKYHNREKTCNAYLQWYDAYSHRYIINPTELPDGGVGSHYVEGLVPDQVLASMFGMMDPFLERDTNDLPDDFRALFEGLFGWYEAWNLTRGVDRRRRM